MARLAGLTGDTVRRLLLAEQVGRPARMVSIRMSWVAAGISLRAKIQIDCSDPKHKDSTSTRDIRIYRVYNRSDEVFSIYAPRCFKRLNPGRYIKSSNALIMFVLIPEWKD